MVYECPHNAAAASRLYGERFPLQVHAAACTFIYVIERARDTGNLKANHGDMLEHLNHLSQSEENVLDIIQEQADASQTTM